jgi:3-hydroxyacyl-[acyl-carrier-protein] dehydratase
MKTLNYYELVFLEVKEKEAIATLILHPGHEIFKGHFPGQPVLPGVCMIQIIKDVVEEITGNRFLLQESKQIKFLKMLIPDNSKPINLSLGWEEDGRALQVNAQLSESGTVVFKFMGTYVPL